MKMKPRNLCFYQLFSVLSKQNEEEVTSEWRCLLMVIKTEGEQSTSNGGVWRGKKAWASILRFV